MFRFRIVLWMRFNYWSSGSVYPAFQKKDQNIISDMRFYTCSCFNISDKIYIKAMIIEYFSLIVLNCSSFLFVFGFQVLMRVEENLMSRLAELCVNGKFGRVGF